ncbi:TPA: hypothetical protein HA251_07120, partial [Candidatus Woesearchaeota archaeon]|nr:hypothetical protein [Candidatus Woesearchaeota archaeon]
MRINSTPLIAILAILLLGTLVIPTAYAANVRDTLPVIVAPENSTGGLTPNTLYHYNFVFANSTDCTPLLNISVNITTNSRGVGNTTLNISALGATPTHICEYINGTLRKTHAVFSTMFDNKTADVDITAYGFDKTSTLNTVFLRNTSLPTCAGGQVLTSAGNGVFSCVADAVGSGGNTSWNETRANTLYLLLNDQRYNETTIINTIQNLTYALIAANIGNFSANNNTIWNAINAGNNLTLTQIAANIGNWSSASANYYTTTQVNTLGNWSADKNNYNTTAQLNTLYAPIGTAGDNTSWNETRANTLYATLGQITSIQNLTLAQIANNIGNWTLDKPNYATTTQVNTSWNESRTNSLYATLSQITSIQNLTLAQIATNIGNWSSASANYYTTTQVNTLGNWSAEKANYATTTQVNTIQNLTLAQISTNLGNWSADKPSYATLAQLNAGVGDNVTRTYIANAVGQNLTLTQIATNIGNWSANNATIWTAINDLRTANNTLNTSITTINTQITTIQNLSLTDINTNLGNWSAVQNLICYTNGTGCPPGTSNNSWNQSHADTLYAPISTISYNTSWNQSHANTLYAPIGVTGDNTSWNETRANNLYAPISSGNASWNETRANTLYLGIGATATNSNQLGGQASDYYWNTSTALITTTQALAALGNASAVNTTLNIQTLGFNTTTQLNTLYAPIGTTGDNTSWNETRANNLYTTPAYITGAVGQNLTYNLITTANGNWSAEKASLHNLTLAQIATNIGNWSNVAANYYTATQINTLGNWTLDKNNYNTTAQLNTLYAPIGVTGDNTSWNETRANNLYAPISSGNASWNETRANSLYLQTNDQRYNDTTTITTLQNLTLTQIANNIGNW